MAEKKIDPRHSLLVRHSQTFNRSQDEADLPLAAMRGLNGLKIFPVLVFEQKPGPEPDSKVLEQNFAKITRDDFLDLIRNSPATLSANGAAQVSARDLHSLDPAVDLHGPSFFVRRNAILVNLRPFKAVVVADKMFLLLSEDKKAPMVRTPSMLPEIMGEKPELPVKTEMGLGHHVQRGYGPVLLSEDLFTIFNCIINEYDNSSFATNALEALLCAYSEFINSQYAELYPMVMEIGSELTKRQSHNAVPVLDKVKMMRNFLDKRHGEVAEAISALDEVLASPTTMARMHLGQTEDQPSLDEIELLFDTYLQAIETTLNKLQDLRNDVEAYNDIKMIHLDQTRNTLLRIDLVFSLVTSLAAVGALVAGIFGMNLNSYVEEEPHWFWVVAGLLLGMLVFGSFGLLVWFRSLGL